MPFTVHPDRPLVRAAGGSRRHVVVRIAAPAAEGGPRPGASVSFVVDRSASMTGRKIARARAAVIEALQKLDARDRFSVIAYDRNVEVVVADAPATESRRTDAIERIRAIEVGAGTNLSGGWIEGCRSLLASLTPEMVGRCFLLTDGQANRGIVDSNALAHKAAELRAAGASTSCFGIGADFDEGVLTRLADAAGGTFRFIESEDALGPMMNDELGEALEIVAREVVVEVVAPVGVEVTVVGPYLVTRAAGGEAGAEAGAEIALPDLVAKQTLELVTRLEIPPGVVAETLDLAFRVRARDAKLGTGACVVSFRYDGDDACESQPRDIDVDRLVAQRHAGAARERAALLNRTGELVRAADELRAVARRIQRYAGNDVALQALIDGLEVDAARMAHRLDETERKSMHSFAASSVRSRRPDGGSQRGS